MIYLNLGRREVGKTTLAAYLISKSDRRVVFDPRGLFPTAQRVTTPEGIDAFGELMRAGKASEMVITPDTELEACFEQACLFVRDQLRVGQKSIAFLVDEMRFLKGHLDSPALNWILRCATRDSVVIVFTCHRPVDVPVDIRAISDVWCIFQTTQANDLEVIAERCSPNVAQKAARLPSRHFLAWNDAGGRLTEHVHPDRWYVPMRSVSDVAANVQPFEELQGRDVRDASRFDWDFTR